MVFAITYDLNKGGQDYPSLYQSIKRLGDWSHPMQNLWFVHTAKTATQIREEVQAAIDNNDSLFVVRVNRGEWDCYMSREAINWLNARV